MTDVLQGGRPDVASHRRLLSQNWATALAVVAVALAVLVPVARHHFGVSEARWLRFVWDKQQAYDLARQEIEAETMARLGVGDAQTLGVLVRALDKEEARRLRDLAGDVAHHHTWTRDVSAAKHSVVRAVLAEVADLERDRDQVRITVVTRSLPSVATPPTLRLVAAADAEVSRIAHAHHLASAVRVPVQLTAGRGAIATLHRITSVPVPLSVTVSSPDTLTLWDLRTGTRRGVPTPVSFDAGATTWPVVAGSLLVSRQLHWGLQPLDGRGYQPLPDADRYVPAGDTTMWQVSGNHVRLYDDNGQPAGPPHRTPPRFNSVHGAMGDRIVFDSNLFRLPGPAYVWNVDTGDVHTYEAAKCGFAMSRAALAFTPCVRNTIIAVVGERRQIRFTAPEGHQFDGMMALSDDGRWLAADLSSDTNANVQLRQIEVFDMRHKTAHVVRADSPVLLLGWAPRADVLVVRDETNSPQVTGHQHLGYWQPGMTSFAAIHIVVGNNTVALLG